MSSLRDRYQFICGVIPLPAGVYRYSSLTLGQRRWPNVGPVFHFSFGPASFCNLSPTDAMTLGQPWPSVCVLAGAVSESENDVSDSEETSFSVTPTRVSCRTPRTASSSDVTSPAALYPRDDCIFCHKGRKKVKGSYENLSTCVTETAENSIKQAAQHKLDYALLGEISDMDLRAREARYHASCRKAYIRDDSRDHHGQDYGSGREEQRGVFYGFQ